ncbi:MAG: chromate efflux transporter [Roseiflexaceae bacterium]|nr:chromate efflux transporter [Roseiflexaceae bacterium]
MTELDHEQAAERIEPATLNELARYFVHLGFTAFGGPAAHIAIMQEDLVKRRRWLTRQHFLDLLAATQLVPGPNSTEMVIHIGYLKQGVKGLFLAGICFIMPAFLIVLILSMIYVAYGSLPATSALFYGIQPVIVAIVVQAIERLARSAWKTPAFLILGIVAAILSLILPVDPVFVIIGGGLVGMLLAGGWIMRGMTVLLVLPTMPGIALQVADPGSTLWQLGLFFLKVGATLMGSGYLLISYIEQDLVGSGLLTARQLIDAIAVGQMTPGPVFTTAAFVGYIVQAGTTGNISAGIIGACVCALAIFLPSFIIIWITAPLVPRMRGSRIMGAFLDGVNAAVVGAMAATTWIMLRAAIINLPHPIYTLPVAGVPIDLPALLIAVIATAILLPKKAPNSTWLIGVGALLGLVLQYTAGNV